jgi:hypothetical protein
MGRSSLPVAGRTLVNPWVHSSQNTGPECLVVTVMSLICACAYVCVGGVCISSVCESVCWQGPARGFSSCCMVCMLLPWAWEVVTC